MTSSPQRFTDASTRPVDDATREQIVTLLRQLVAVDTTTGNPTRPAIEHILSVLGDRVDEMVEIPSSLPGDGPDVIGVAVRIGAKAPGGTVLCGHLDCVPVTGQTWTTDPFALHVDGEQLRGRGVTDMKGFIAVATVLAATTESTAPITLLLTTAEEIGALGARAAGHTLAGVHPEPAQIIVGEPTGLQRGTSHNGVVALRTTFSGISAHSSRPDLGRNVLIALSAMIQDVQKLLGDDERAAEGLPHRTWNPAEVHAGSALNIIPDTAEFVWEFRPAPSDDADALLTAISSIGEEIDRTLGVSVTTEVASHLPALAAGTTPANVSVLSTDSPVHLPFGTDAGPLAALGFPVVVWGPGNISDAHTANEAIEMSELLNCYSLLERFLAGAAG